METLLLILGATIAGLINGVQAMYYGSLGAALDALLAPFNNERRMRHLSFKVDRYYQRLTRQDLQSQLRSDLREGVVHSSGMHKEMRRIFDEFAVSNDGQAGGKVWTEKQFSAFLSSRLGNDDAAHALWRCFCYNATFPFLPDPKCPFEVQQLDIHGWTQAVALLASNASHYVGHNLRQLFLYEPSQNVKSRRICAWRRFFSLSLPIGDDSDINVDFENKKDEWRLPSELDEVTSLVATQLPLGMCVRGPPLSEIQPRVKKLVNESGHGSNYTQTFVIPYEDMLSILCAMLQVGRTDDTTTSINTHPKASIISDTERQFQTAIAKGILDSRGFNQGSSLLFEDYLEISERFFSSEPWPARSFEQKLALLWHGIFKAQDSSDSSALSFSRRPPSFILQAIDLLYPFTLTAFDFPKLQHSTLMHPRESDLSRNEILQSLTWPYSSKFIIIYGMSISKTYLTTQSEETRSTRSRTQQNAKASQPAVLTIMTSSPLWCRYKTGAINDFIVDDTHFLLELAPCPRILWYKSSSTKQPTKFADLVDTSDGSSISFGHRARQSTATATNGSIQDSGLTLDLDAGAATLSSTPNSSARQQYVEIPIGPRDGPLKKVENPQSWTTVVKIERIEVYSGPDGVPCTLSIRRRPRRQTRMAE